MLKKCYSWGKCVITGFFSNHCTMQAAALTYFSLLTLVPLLCILLLAAKTFGAGNLVRDHINTRIDSAITRFEASQDESLAQMTAADEAEREAKKKIAKDYGGKARDLSNRIFDRVDKFDVSTVGWIGLGVLLWTVVGSISMVEESFNQIWNVPKPRTIWKRMWMYLAVVIILPLIGAMAMSLPILNIVKNVLNMTFGQMWITQWLSSSSIWFLESLLFRIAISVFFASLDFAFLFYALPHCKVKFSHAFWSGMVTAFLFAGWMKLCAIAQVGVAKSSAIYGSLAFLPIIVTWLYMSWQIVLFGANMTYAFGKVGEEGQKSGK